MRDHVELAPGQGTVLSIHDATLTIKSGWTDTDGSVSLLEGAFQPGGFAPLPHVHRREEESFYVVEGRFAFRVGDRRTELDAGAFVHVPAGRLHGFAPIGPTTGRLLILHAPALDGFFRELADLAAGGPPDPSAVADLMGAWGMDVPGSAQ